MTESNDDIPEIEPKELARFYRRFGYASDILRTRAELEEQGLTTEILIENGTLDLSVDICELSQQAPTIEGYLKMAGLALAAVEALTEISEGGLDEDSRGV